MAKVVKRLENFICKYSTHVLTYEAIGYHENHRKSINFQDVSIRRSFSTGFIPVEQDLHLLDFQLLHAAMNLYQISFLQGVQNLRKKT